MKPSFGAVRNGDTITFTASYMAPATNYSFVIEQCFLEIPTPENTCLLDVKIDGGNGIGGCAMTHINGEFEIDDPSCLITQVKFNFQGAWLTVDVVTRCGT
jgi:hypothetical protein